MLPQQLLCNINRKDFALYPNPQSAIRNQQSAISNPKSEITIPPFYLKKISCPQPQFHVFWRNQH